MKKIFLSISLAILCLFCLSSQSFARAKYSDYVEAGGKNVRTSSLMTYKLMETYPLSTITVYNAGTTTLAAIYSDSSGTVKANPFTADSKAYYEFYADNGLYDIKYSGAGIVTPWTISNIPISDPRDNYNPLSFGAKCDNSTNDTAAFNTIISLASLVNITIDIPKLGPCRVGTMTFPAYVTLNYGSTGGLYPRNNGDTIFILGPQTGPKTKRYYHSLSGEGIISFAGNYFLDQIYPEWWGAKGDSGTTDNSPPTTAAIAASQSVTLGLTVNSGVPVKFGVGEYKFSSNITYSTGGANQGIVIEGTGFSTVFYPAADNLTILNLNQGVSVPHGLIVRNIYFDLQQKDSAAMDLNVGGNSAIFENLWVMNPKLTGTKKLIKIGGEFISLSNVMVGGTLGGGVFPATIQNTNVGIYITNAAPFRIQMNHVSVFSLATGISEDSTYVDGATITISDSSISGNLTGVDFGQTAGVALTNLTFERNQFESNMIHLRAKGISENFPIHSLSAKDNYFTGIDATMVAIYMENIDRLSLIDNHFKNGTVADHTGVAVQFAGSIKRATKRGNISVTSPTNISPNMTIVGNSTAGLAANGGLVFQSAALGDNEDSLDLVRVAAIAPSFALTYGVTIATNSVSGEVQTINVTDGVGFTISNPTNPITGRYLTYDILNSSGGAMGTITWGAAFKLVGGTFTNPANTKRRRITFWYNGTNWIEDRRSSGDI